MAIASQIGIEAVAATDPVSESTPASGIFTALPPAMAHLKYDPEKRGKPTFAVRTADGSYYALKLSDAQQKQLEDLVAGMGWDTTLPYDLNLDDLLLERAGDNELHDEIEGIQPLRRLYEEVIDRKMFPWSSVPRGARTHTMAPDAFVRKSARCAGMKPKAQEVVTALSHGEGLDSEKKIERLKRDKVVHLLLDHSKEVLQRLKERTERASSTKEESRRSSVIRAKNYLDQIDAFGLSFEAMHPLSLRELSADERKTALEKKAQWAKDTIERQEIPEKEGIKDRIFEAPYFSGHKAVDAKEEEELAKQYALMGMRGSRRAYQIGCSELGLEPKRDSGELFFAQLMDTLVQSGKEPDAVFEEAMRVIQTDYSFKLAFGQLQPDDQAHVREELVDLCRRLVQWVADPRLSVEEVSDQALYDAFQAQFTEVSTP